MARYRAIIGGGLLVLIMPLMVSAQEQADSSAIEDTLRRPLFHSAPPVIVNNRPYLIELFIDLDPVEIQEVLLHVRGDSAAVYQEVRLEGQYGRYRYSVPKERLQIDTLTYYFVVAQKDYGIWAFPTDSRGEITPYKLEVVESTIEYFRRYGNVR
ncbi:MAG: hypothetical protein KAU50_11065 [Candidatus Marinimicrobia bacterium]|nr:hypothetical protein [Candidatus Neomarinimicrobiota bacterium]